MTLAEAVHTDNESSDFSPPAKISQARKPTKAQAKAQATAKTKPVKTKVTSLKTPKVRALLSSSLILTTSYM